GTEGDAFIQAFREVRIVGKENWTYQGDPENPYQVQHNELFASIRKGKPMNDGEMMANSTMLGILGRMVAYSGQTISWEDAINSNQKLGPDFEDYSWDLKYQDPAIAMPGVTKVLG